MEDFERLIKMSPEDRKSILESDALAVEEGKYTKPLSPEELAYYKDKLAEKSIQQATLLDELQVVKDQYKAKLEPVREDIKMSLQAVKFKAIECNGKLYKLADVERQMIFFIDELGNIVSSRAMIPEERQLRFQILKQHSA